MYDFDKVIDRHGTGCAKLAELQQLFGTSDLTPLWIADMDFAVCPEITRALHERIEHPIYGYAVAPDSYWESIINWLDDRHDFEVKREELTFVPGVVKGIGYAVNHFSRKGDKIIIQPPVYHPFKRVIEGNGREVLANPLVLTPEGNYEMDLAGLERLVKEHHPAMMILCNPHNPVGIQWSRETLAEVGRICREGGVVCVSDEIHGDLVLHGKPHYPFAACSDDCAAVAVTFGAPSKTFNIPGLVSSWCVIKNPELRHDFYEWLEVNEFSTPTFVSTIGTEAAYRNGGRWLTEAMAYIEENIRMVSDFLAERVPSVGMIKPQASFLVWMDFRKLSLSHDQLVDLVVNRAHLALNDGEMFGSEGHGFMRVNVATPRTCLLAALRRLEEAVNQIKVAVNIN
ncbi:MAG: pyridoxal phosphate-dependent aminotransferase [Muribaculaceae bacterium]|nr:pyridoxal phosphate-dependent aminotransferase [Muribaculaceae bacterium]